MIKLTGAEILMTMLKEKNVDCRPFFNPLSSLPAYANLRNIEHARNQNSVSYQISPYGINMPSALNLKKEDVKYVCDTLKSVLYK